MEIILRILLHEPYKELKRFYFLINILQWFRTLHEPYKELKLSPVATLASWNSPFKDWLHEPYKELKQCDSN